MSAPTARHETRALLRAHLAAASGYRHLTRHCPICHRLLRLAMEPLTAPQELPALREPGNSPEARNAPEAAGDGHGRGTEEESGPAGTPTEGGNVRAEPDRDRRAPRPGGEGPPAA
ncbi:DUF6274 family protein [Streptomyces sp. NPDC006289]|uniref:DUF6274 family protein n=1 Tax=Streptomyces sp. NPDC006289 TaxID=3156744 RepID=UPI0033AE2E28